MKHKIEASMENKPGVLSRISKLFAQKNFNIEDISAKPTENHDVTKMVVTIDGDKFVAEQAASELEKLEDVLEIHLCEREENC